MYAVKRRYHLFEKCINKGPFLSSKFCGSIIQFKCASPCGVAQWTSHPPQEKEDPGSNPAWV
jgi:hypothetical protein